MAQVFCTPETKKFLNGFDPDLVGKTIPGIAKTDVAIFRPSDLKNLLSDEEREALENHELTDDQKIEFAKRVLDLLPGTHVVKPIEGAEATKDATLKDAELAVAHMFISSMRGYGEPMNLPVDRLNDQLKGYGFTFESDVSNVLFVMEGTDQAEMSAFFMKVAGVSDSFYPKAEGEYASLMDTVPADVLYLHTLLHECAHIPQTHADDSKLGRLRDEIDADTSSIPPLLAIFNKVSGSDISVGKVEFIEHMRALQTINSHSSSDHSTNIGFDIDKGKIEEKFDAEYLFKARDNVREAMFVTIRSLCEDSMVLRDRLKIVNVQVDESDPSKALFSDVTKGKFIASEFPEMRYVAMKSLLQSGYFKEGSAEHEIASEYVDAVEALLPFQAKSDLAQMLVSWAEDKDDLFSGALTNGEYLKQRMQENQIEPSSPASETDPAVQQSTAM